MGLGSRIGKKPIPDPGSRGKKGTGSRIRIRNTGSITQLMDAMETIRERDVYTARPRTALLVIGKDLPQHWFNHTTYGRHGDN